MCSNGHNLCNTCRPQFRNCPTCRGKMLSNLRNFTAEIVSRNITHSCRFKTAGCTAQLAAAYKLQHEEEVCRHRPLRCPFFMMGCCQWAGQLGEIMKHVKLQHIQEKEITEFKFSTRFRYYKRSSGTEMLRHDALYILGDIYFLRVNTMNGYLYLSLLFVGEKEEASVFSYEVTLHSECFGLMSARQQCRSYLEMIDDQLWIKKTELCVAFHLSFVEQCMEDDHIVFHFELFNDST
ncbi:hypothetical protein C0J52_19744 [Blattella germanica]|nr:hypothetical protein C0J52_19744 [Blattella germanica]